MVSSANLSENLRKLPLAFAFVLEALLALSLATSGLLSPALPQVSGNLGYRQLWRGNVAGSGGALHFFRNALEADSAFPYRWSDLGEALLLAGAPDRAGYCFDRSVELAPHDPQIRLRAANYYFRTRQTEPALRLDSAVLDQVPDYDQMIFSSYLRMGGAMSRVLDTGIGSNARAAGEFFRFLRPRSDDATLDTVWRWMEDRGFVTVPLALSRTSWLLDKGLPGEASAVWRRYVAPADSSFQKSEWIVNSGFESPWTGEGFDWRVEACNGVDMSLDSRIAHSGRGSLRIRFHAFGNLDFHHVSQLVWLSPGSYRLSAWIRSEDFQPDPGIGLSLLDATTPVMSGTHGWTQVSSEFTVVSVPRLARVRVVRKPSLKFDGQPRGTVWIDEVEVKRVS